MRIASLLAPLFPGLDRPLRGDDSPLTLGAWDSLRQAEIVLSVEDQFHVDLSTQEILALTSVASVVEVLKKRGLDVEI